jgi:hypothetical protein
VSIYQQVGDELVLASGPGVAPTQPAPQSPKQAKWQKFHYLPRRLRPRRRLIIAFRSH